MASKMKELEASLEQMKEAMKKQTDLSAQLTLALLQKRKAEKQQKAVKVVQTTDATFSISTTKKSGDVAGIATFSNKNLTKSGNGYNVFYKSSIRPAKAFRLYASNAVFASLNTAKPANIRPYHKNGNGEPQTSWKLSIPTVNGGTFTTYCAL